MPLNLTKVAFGQDSLDTLDARIRLLAERGEGLVLTTRYLPKRVGEMGGGSLYWIIKHQLVGRSPILRFGDAEGGRVAIHLEPRVILVVPRRKRAHQGWRYLEGADVPPDIGADGAGVGEMPPRLVGELNALALL